jgi:hypothetical protein
VTATVAITAALGASASAAVAAALQSRTAGHPPEQRTGAVEGLSGFARQQLARGLWWAALVVQALGFGLHSLALSAGALTLVQPLMASAIVLALPLNHYLNRTKVTRAELLWAGLLSVGLSGFLATSATGRPLVVGSVGRGSGGAALVAVLLVAGCVWWAGRSGSRRAAALLGTAAAIAFAAEAALLQDVVGTVLTHPRAALDSPAGYGLVVAGVAGVVLTQLAYRAGPIAAALPAIVTVNPLLSVVYGAVVLHDPFRHSPGAIGAELLCFALLVVGALALTRLSAPATSGAGSVVTGGPLDGQSR